MYNKTNQTKKELLALLLREEGIEPLPIQTSPRREGDAPPPLSFAQQRLWFLNQLNPNSPLHNQLFAYRLVGSLHLEVLEKTFATIIKRHEILRTTFQVIDGEPIQIIKPSLPLFVPLIDLRIIPKSEKEKLLLQETKKATRHHFDLTVGPLIRILVFCLRPQEHVVLLILHHIVSDGWSTGVLIREITTLYDAFLMGKPVSLPDLPIQYADFAVGQRQWLQDEKLKTLLAYWRQKLEDAPRLGLPTDRPRPPVQTFNGAMYVFELPKSLMNRLVALCRQEAATLFMLLLAAFNVLLYRYTKQEDIVIGSPIANRNRVEVQNLIGFFVNTLVLRVDLSGHPSFRELLRRIQQVALDAYDHQDLPFEKLVEALNPDRHLSYQPLFQVMFLYNTYNPSLHAHNLTLIPLYIDFGVSQFDITLSIVEAQDATQGFVEYSTDLFDQRTIEYMMQHYVTILTSCAVNPDQQISAIPLMSDIEKKQVLSLAKGQDEVIPLTGEFLLHRLFERQASQTPDAVAVIAGEERLTYHCLNNRANQLAHMLRAHGVGPEICVALCTHRSLEMIIGILGILKAGGAYVPLDPTYPPARLEYVLADIQAPVLLTQVSLRENFAGYEGEIISLDETEMAVVGASTENPDGEVTAVNLAYVIYTSGSTGQPKGAMITHANVVRLFAATQSQFQFRAQDVWTLFHSYAFDFSVWEIWGALLYGGCLVIVPYLVSRTPEAFYELLCTQHVTVLNQTPSAFRQLMPITISPNATHNLSLRLVIFGGEALALHSLKQWYIHQDDKHPQLINMYGITETTVHVTYRLLHATDIEKVPGSVIGNPLADLQLYILDEGLEPVPVGVQGELYVGGDGLARGYHHRAGLTAERFVPNPFVEADAVTSSGGGARLYKTGDLARWLADGDIEYLGRNDHQVKIRGFRVELEEIEAALAQHPAVWETAVLAQADRAGQQQLVTYIVSREAVPPGDILRRFLQERLPDYMVPAFFIPLDRFPLTPNGKLDRRALPAPPTARPHLESDFVAPRIDVEIALATIWGNLLGIEQIGVYDNFFTLGGHSLLAAQLLVRLNDFFQINLSIRDLFLAPTIEKLAQRASEEMAKKLNQKDFGLLKSIPRRIQTGSAPLSYAQQRLWFLSQLFPDSSAYNLRFAVQLTGEINTPVLIQSINFVIQRHEILRTSFADISGNLLQIILSEYKLDLPVINLGQLPPHWQKLELQYITESEGSRSFDLVNGPLWRVIFITLADDEHVLLGVMHHIIFDGWSFDILVSEISEHYKALLNNAPPTLPELAIQYADFAEWQREQLQDGLSHLLAYWKSQLADLPFCQIPTDYPRPQIQTFNGAVYTFSFSQDLSREIKAFSSHQNVTLFMTLLAAFVVLLRYYISGDDIVVGTDIANRNHPQLEKLIGFFVNQLVIRVHLGGNPDFHEVLWRVREVTTNAYVHQDLPFDRLVEALEPKRELGSSPFFQTKFVLQNASVKKLEIPGVVVRPYSVPVKTAKFDILLNLEESESQLFGRLEYSTDLFKASTMIRFVEHLNMILNQVMTMPAIRLDTLMAALNKWDAQQTDEKRRVFQEIRQQKLRKLGTSRR